MVVHEDEGESGEAEQAGGYGDQTMLVQRVSGPSATDMSLCRDGWIDEWMETTLL